MVFTQGRANEQFCVQRSYGGRRERARFQKMRSGGRPCKSCSKIPGAGKFSGNCEKKWSRFCLVDGAKRPAQLLRSRGETVERHHQAPPPPRSAAPRIKCGAGSSRYAIATRGGKRTPANVCCTDELPAVGKFAKKGGSSGVRLRRQAAKQANTVERHHQAPSATFRGTPHQVRGRLFPLRYRYAGEASAGRRGLRLYKRNSLPQGILQGIWKKNGVGRQPGRQPAKQGTNGRTSPSGAPSAAFRGTPHQVRGRLFPAALPLRGGGKRTPAQVLACTDEIPCGREFNRELQKKQGSNSFLAMEPKRRGSSCEGGEERLKVAAKCPRPRAPAPA